MLNCVPGRLKPADLQLLLEVAGPEDRGDEHDHPDDGDRPGVADGEAREPGVEAAHAAPRGSGGG